MLILTRRIGESLRIGDDVSLMVLGVQGNQVRIGVDAPKHISVHREEIYRRIQQEKLIQAEGGAPASPPPGKQRESAREPDSQRDFPITSQPPTQTQDHSGTGTRFYSTEGHQGNQAPKKTPNVIIKKKRPVESA